MRLSTGLWITVSNLCDKFRLSASPFWNILSVTASGPGLYDGRFAWLRLSGLWRCDMVSTRQEHQ